MSTPSIEYVPNPMEPTPSQVFGGESMAFGLYKVRFPDGWTVAVPHIGTPGTVSADPPFDLEDDEHRAIILAEAERSKPQPDDAA